MQIICISRGTSRAKKVAERLAGELGLSCLSREELVEAAIQEGIQVSKLETAMIKPQIFTERLALEREYYRAFTTLYLCERAMAGGLVYHGRTGHLLLPGISHVLRARVVEDENSRIKDAMNQLGVDLTRARRYINNVDEDMRRWVHSMYGVPWEDAAHYDIILNLNQMSLKNGADALTHVAQLPDFQMTPVSTKAIEDLRLGAKARLFLARDDRTKRANVKVRADDGIITATYLPHDAGVKDIIPEIFARLEGVREIRATMATTNILWIQEAFERGAETFRQVVQIATKWNAAVELLQLIPGNEYWIEEQESGASETAEATMTQNPSILENNGGIEDDDEEELSCEDRGLKSMLEELAKLGRSGGGKVVCGGVDRILHSIDQTAAYSLVVIGDIFLAKGHASRMRMARQLQSYLSDHVKAPIVNVEELKTQYLFSKRDLLRMLGYFGLVVLSFALVFANQEPILKFLSETGTKAKFLSPIAVFLFVPIFAYLYGNIAKSLMKLIKME